MTLLTRTDKDIPVLVRPPNAVLAEVNGIRITYELSSSSFDPDGLSDVDAGDR